MYDATTIKNMGEMLSIQKRVLQNTEYSVVRGRQRTFLTVEVYDSLWFIRLQIDITHKTNLK